jgi:hypothetical protein
MIGPLNEDIHEDILLNLDPWDAISVLQVEISVEILPVLIFL